MAKPRVRMRRAAIGEEERSENVTIPTKILLLEDSDADAALLEQELRRRKFRAKLERVCTEEGLRAALAAQSFDIIVSDYTMPSFDGLRGLAVLKETGLDIPFIILSGTMGEQRAVEAMKAGASDYIIKGDLARLVPAMERELRDAQERTQRRDAEAALMAAQANFRALVENSIVGIYVIQGDRFVYVNPAVAEVLGYTAAEITSRPLLDFVDPAHRAVVRENIRKRFAGEADRIRYAVQMVRRDGKPLRVEVQGAMTSYNGKPSILGVLLDTTKQQRAEARFKTVFRSSPLGIVLSACPSGEVLEANSAFLALIGREKENAIGGNLKELAGWQNPGEVDGFIHGAAERSARHLETTIRAGSTSPKNVTVTTDKVEVAGEICALTFLDDVTEEKKMEIQLLRNQRMDSIGALAGGIAHDLNNALAPILMSVQLLRMRLDDPEMVRTLDVLQASAERGADMVKQVLSFARGVEGGQRNVPTRHLLRDIGALMKHTFPKSIQIREDVEKGVWPIIGDPTQIHQILLNLCVNARDAMPAGGTLTIGASNVQLDESMARMHGGIKPGPCVLLRVADSGSGIPPEVQARMFEPFFTTKEAGKGTGLGLSTVQNIVKSHGGILRLETAPNRGTEFSIYLPGAPSAAAEGQPAERLTLPAGNGEWILVVDDEALISDMARQVLEAFGYNVMTAANGAEAVAACAKAAGKIRVMVTDLTMPVMDGRAAIEAVRVLDPSVSVIVASGSCLDPVKPPSAAVSAALEKPYTPEKLLTTIHAVLNREERVPGLPHENGLRS